MISAEGLADLRGKVHSIRNKWLSATSTEFEQRIEMSLGYGFDNSYSYVFVKDEEAAPSNNRRTKTYRLGGLMKYQQPRL